MAWTERTVTLAIWPGCATWGAAARHGSVPANAHRTPRERIAGHDDRKGACDVFGQAGVGIAWEEAGPLRFAPG